MAVLVAASKKYSPFQWEKIPMSHSSSAHPDTLTTVMDGNTSSGNTYMLKLAISLHEAHYFKVLQRVERCPHLHKLLLWPCWRKRFHQSSQNEYITSACKHKRGCWQFKFLDNTSNIQLKVSIFSDKVWHGEATSLDSSASVLTHYGLNMCINFSSESQFGND